MSQSQPPVDRDDLPFRHFSAKHRLVAWISQNLFDRVTYTAHHGLIAGMKRKGGLGWLPVRPEPTAEQRFWAQLDLRGFTIYDVGAFQGLSTLFFARQAKEVISYEPNTKNHARLRASGPLKVKRGTNLSKRSPFTWCHDGMKSVALNRNRLSPMPV